MVVISCAASHDTAEPPGIVLTFLLGNHNAPLEVNQASGGRQMRRAMIAATVLLGLMCFAGCSDNGKDNSPAQQGATGSGSASGSSGTSGDAGEAEATRPAAPSRGPIQMEAAAEARAPETDKGRNRLGKAAKARLHSKVRGWTSIAE